MDADGHLNENEGELREYMEPPYNSYLLQGSSDARGWTTPGIAIAVTRVFDASLGGKLGRSGPPGNGYEMVASGRVAARAPSAP